MDELGQTILVVDDEPQIRQLIRLCLKNLDCAVLEASSGTEAKHLFQAHQQRIAALLTDVVMPGMHGDELAAQLLALRPSLRVVFISGFCDEIRPSLKHCVCVRKPFRLEDVRGVVAAILNADTRDGHTGT